MYGCSSGDLGFESRLVIESFCLVRLSNSPELGSWRHVTTVPRQSTFRVAPAPNLSSRVTEIERARCFCAYIATRAALQCLLQMASLNEIGRHVRNRSGGLEYY
ncbi:unnamed protein product, partial [Brenthis ino]